MTMATRHPGSIAVALVVACASLGVAAPLAHGQVVRFVDSSAPGPGHNGLSWPTAYLDLQDALDETLPFDSGIDEIWVAVGSLDAAGNPLGYVPTRLTLNSDDLRTVTFRMQKGVTTAFGIFGGFLGNAPGGGEVLRVQRNPEANETILDGHFPAPPPLVCIGCPNPSQDCFQPDAALCPPAGTPDGTMIGCDDSYCCCRVCAEDPSCCHPSDNMWDACCAQLAHELCPFSLNAYHVVTGINLTNLAVLDGFTITGGVADDNHRTLIADENQLHGGGIFLSSPDANMMQDGPVIARCRLVDNDAEDGAGLYSEVGPTGGSEPTFANLEFRGNSATNDGGGAWSGPGNQPLWVNCLFAGNTAENNGGGLFMMDGTSNGLTNATFVSNSAIGGIGGGVYLDGTGASPPTTIANCIFWLNTDFGGSGADAQVAVAGFAVTLAESDVQDGLGALPSGVLDGGGNIDEDPQFVNPATGNYRLRAFSPCVEVGENMALPLDLADLDQNLVVMEPTPRDLDINDRVIDSPDVGPLATVDMGAYEFVASPCPWDCDPVPGDGVVGITEFLAVLGTWGVVGAPCDLTGGPGVGIVDFLAMLGNWGPCTPSGPEVPSLQEEIENAGLVWPDDWDAFVDVMVNGTQAQGDNYLCWMKHYLEGNCHGLLCIPPTCPGPDPFSSPPLAHMP